MRIDDAGRFLDPKITRPTERSSEPKQVAEKKASGGKRVEKDAISIRANDPGIEKAAVLETDVGVEGLSPDQVDEIRSKIHSGAYDEVRVLEAIARRILERLGL